MSSITRPVIRYFGGKWKIAPWIITHFPPHRVYVEPFGGAGSVLLRKPRSYAEVYNDRDDEIVNVFRVLRDATKAARLREQLELTPFARTEFKRAYKTRPADDVEAAANMIVRAYMGFGSASMTSKHQTGFRANSHRSGTTAAHDWSNYPDVIPAFVDRLRGVVIENKDAMAVMEQQDSQATLHYVDPPYVHDTRSSLKYRRPETRHFYKHEMTDDDHRQLLDFLQTLTGMVIVSGYASKIYETALAGWTRKEFSTHADGARPRIEVLWMNGPATQASRQSTLFG